jgi:hypothetical protein
MKSVSVCILFLASTVSVYADNAIDILGLDDPPVVVFSRDACNVCMCCEEKEEFYNSDFIRLIVSSGQNQSDFGKLSFPKMFNKEFLSSFLSKDGSSLKERTLQKSNNYSWFKIVDFCNRHPESCELKESTLTISPNSTSDGLADFKGWTVLRPD